MAKAKANHSHIERINAIAELQRCGVAFDHVGDGEIRLRCPVHEDTNPSCSFNIEKNLWICQSCKAKGDIIGFIAYVLGVSRGAVFLDLASRYDLEEVKTINPKSIELWHSQISEAGPLLRALYDRGISDETIRKYRIGYDAKASRITIPIADSQGRYLNVRKYLPGAPGPEKMKNVHGFSKPRLYPEKQLNNDKIWICAGELKALVVAQLLGKEAGAICVTAGEGSWNSEWNKLFTGKEVYLCFDIDRAGKTSAAKIGTSVAKYASKVYQINLPLDPKTYPKGDINDYVGKEGATTQELMKLMSSAQAFVPLCRVVAANNPEEDLDSDLIPIPLGETKNPELVGKRILTSGVVIAADTDPYLVPKEVRVFCDKNQPNCYICPIHGIEPTDEGLTNGFVDVIVDPTNKGLLNYSGTPEGSIGPLVQSTIGIPKCKSVQLNIRKRYALREVRVQSQLEIQKHDMDTLTHTAYVVGDKTELNVAYQFQAILWESPKTQVACLLIYAATRSEDSLDSFDPSSEELEELEIFQPEEWTVEGLATKLDNIYSDLETNVTGIYARRDMHLLMDLAYHSVLFFDFEGRTRNGWINALLLGDSAQGKSELINRLMAHYKLGDKVDCRNASVSGLLGGLKQMGSRWFITWGAIPRHDRRIVFLEEMKGATTDTISKLTEMRSSGIAEIDKIEQSKTQARTRVVCISNARQDNPLSYYDYGITAIRELIGAPEDIRRFDIAAIADARDLVGVNLSATRRKVAHTYTSELCRRLVLFAWTINKGIVFEDEALVIEVSSNLLRKYSSTIPLVDTGTMHLKVAKLAIALANRTYSIDKDKVLVRKCHIEYIGTFLDKLYSDNGFGYDRFAQAERDMLTLRDPEVVIRYLRSSANPHDLVDFLTSTSEILATDLEDYTGNKDAGNELLYLLARKKAIRRKGKGRMYIKNPAFIELLKTIDLSNVDREDSNIGSEI